MTLLRVLNIVAWAVMLAYMLPGAWAASFKGARYGDPMRLACALTALVIIGFNVRSLLAATDAYSLNGLLVLSIATALFILRLGRTYGRGPLLHKSADD